MKIGVTFIICSLLYMAMVSIIYFSKKRVNNMENKMYSILLKINIIGLIIELCCCYFVYNADVSIFHEIINVFVNKLYLIYLLIWEFIFTSYVFFISFNDQKDFNKKLEKNKNKISLGVLIFFIIMLLCVLFLPLYYYNDGYSVYSYGPATDLLTLIGGLFVLFDIFCVVKNIKNIKSKKYYPLFSLIILMIVVLIIRNINPGLILINSTFAFVTIFMYHTIENPDVLLIEELYKNKTLVEETNEEKSNFLFNMSQEVRNHVKTIANITNESLNSNDIDAIKENLKLINNNNRQLDFVVNHVLDVSTIDAQNIKIMKSRYNVYNLFDELNVRAKQTLFKNVDLRFNVSKNIPKYLFGDALKLKQVLITIIENATKHTKHGFVEVNVNVVEKYDICRLIINIEDSGIGMSLEAVNDILTSNKEITEDEIIKLNKLDFITCKKIINLLGGSLMIRSEENKGTKVTVTIDQKIVFDKEKSDKLKKYNSLVTINKKILVVDDKAHELKTIKDYLNTYDYNIHTTMYKKDCLKKIENDKYDLLILDDDLVDGSAFDIMQELKNKQKNNIPIVVMIDEAKLSIKKHYLNDGFDDVVVKNKLESELKRIVEKY